MTKLELKKKLERQAKDAGREIEQEILPELELLRCELEYAARLMERSEGTPAWNEWCMDVEIINLSIFQEEEKLNVREALISRTSQMLAEIEADIASELATEQQSEIEGDALIQASPAVSGI